MMNTHRSESELTESDAYSNPHEHYLDLGICSNTITTQPQRMSSFFPVSLRQWGKKM